MYIFFTQHVQEQQGLIADLERQLEFATENKYTQAVLSSSKNQVQPHTSLSILPSDSAHYAHTDLSYIITEMWDIPVFSLADGAIILHMIK